MLAQVRLSPLLQRCGRGAPSGNGAAASGLDCSADWAAMLSLGEQQRLAFGRCALKNGGGTRKGRLLCCSFLGDCRYPGHKLTHTWALQEDNASPETQCQFV